MRKPTRLTDLRKAAPGSLTGMKLEAFFQRKRYPRSFQTILNFERGQYKSPDPRFVKLYAEAIGQPVAAVRRALEQTLRARAARTGPFSE